MALEKIDIDTLDPAATIVVATGNAHKLTEIEAHFGQGYARGALCGAGSAGRF